MSEIVSCLKGTSSQGVNWYWVSSDVSGVMQLTNGPLHLIGDDEPVTGSGQNTKGPSGDEKRKSRHGVTRVSRPHK